MVSTRGHKYKFSEGERVLCYEPDPTKAKVLYDSKVLEVIETKDKRGRRSVEYLIHFQGWNSSWDRCVSEDFVLKDTEDNRQLQRTLAEKSQLQLGAYLYRRRGGSGSAVASGSGVTSTGKRPRTAFEDEGSSSSSRHPEDEAAGSDSSGSGSSSHTSAEQCTDGIPPPNNEATLPLGPGLRDRLTMDYHLVTKRGRLAWLPARPSVLEVLQSCVHHHADKAATAPSRPRRSKTGPDQPDLEHHLRRLNLLRQVADGLRIYFDFILKDQLLYEQEEAQYQEAITRKIMREPRAPQKNEEPSEARGGPEEYAHLPPSPADEGPDSSGRRLRSHKSPTSTPQPMETTEEATPTIKDVPGPSAVETPPASIDGSTELNGTSTEVFRRLLDWRIVPPEHPPFPTAVYGATHLARLFVKLPEYLSLIIMPESKLNLIIEYVDIFVKFLEEHEEWFGESFYYDTNPSTS